MIITSQVEGNWPQPTSIILQKNENTLWGKTTRTKRNGEHAAIELEIGCSDGISAAVLAHEAHHAARFIMSDPKWKEFMPKWNNIRYQSEESISFIIECIVWQGLVLVEKHGIRITNPLRKV